MSLLAVCAWQKSDRKGENVDVLHMDLLGPWMALLLAACGQVAELRTDKIPHALIVVGLVAGISLGLYTGTVFDRVAGLSIAGVVMLPLFRMGIAGGGFVKLAAAIGCLLGLDRAFDFVLAVLVCIAIAFGWYRVTRRVHPHTANQMNRGSVVISGAIAIVAGLAYVGLL